jgi:glycosyltransferase involved in cell wall biosynthesis
MQKIQEILDEKFGNIPYVSGYKILDLKENCGAGNALFEGFKIADGDYICYLSADDMITDVNKTQLQLNHMITKEADLSYCDLYTSGDDITNASLIKSSFVFTYNWFNKFILYNNYLTYFMLNFKNPINSSTFMMKQQSINRYGTWDPNLKGDCDGDILLRWSLYHAKIIEIECTDPVIYYRLHKNQISNNSSIMSESMLYNRKKYRTYVLERKFPLWLRLMTKIFVRV